MAKEIQSSCKKKKKRKQSVTRGIPKRGQPSKCYPRPIVKSIYYFDPSQIATEGFSSPFISLRYTEQHIKSLEKSKKGKI